MVTTPGVNTGGTDPSDEEEETGGSTTVESTEPVTITEVYVDTAQLDLAAGRYEQLATRGGWLSDRAYELLNSPPLVDGRTDSTWDDFASEYVPGMRMYAQGVAALGRACQQISVEIENYAQLAAAVEEAATTRAKSLDS